MNESVRKPLTDCPKCGKELEPTWSVCPYCGLRVKVTDSLIVRAIIWAVVLYAYVQIGMLLQNSNPDQAGVYWLLVGFPLAYTFGKAVIFRLSGRPLTFSQLGVVSVRVAFYTFIVTVVAPLVIGIALILIFLSICLYSGGIGGGPH